MKKNIVIICLVGLLLALGVVTFHSRHSDNERINELKAQVKTLQQQGENSELDRSVSEQMEFIAHGQQALSEERSEEAIRQSEIAQAATLRSEAERQKAQRAQAVAETAAEEALASYQLAEQQRQRAEYAKTVADKVYHPSIMITYFIAKRSTA